MCVSSQPQIKRHLVWAIVTNIATVSISGAVSIPFILVAFNQDRISAWVKRQKMRSIIWLSFLVLIVAILLSIIWTKRLASGMKAAVTVAVVLLIVAGAISRFIYQVITGTVGQFAASSEGSGSVTSI